jgi:filamentous hemagglutinin family protein
MPEKPEVRAGQATITRPNVGATHIQQGSNAAIIHWQSFNIGAHESVRFTMPNGQAAVLNRVTGNQGSNIYGRLQANGQVYLINRNGIVIGKDARIDTNGFTASTLDVADQDFLDGAGLSFLGDGTAGVTNHGVIRARDGDVLLLGQTVNNTGEISAPNGTVGLAAGTEIRYQPDANQAVLVRSGISSDGADTGVDNSGVIEAAAAELKAAGGSVYELAVNQQGVVRAGAVRKEGGRILLTAAGGTVRQAGKLEARKGEDGGEILVGGSFQGKADPEIDNAARTLVTSEAEIDVSATGKAGDGGTAVVWADESTQFHGSIAARSGADGGKGGDAEVSGKKHLDFQPEKIDLHGVDGRGELLLDPADVDIQSGTTSNAQESPANTFTFVDGTTPTVIDAADVETALAGADVTVQTNDQGSITTTADINWTSASALTLDSGKSISIDGSISGDSGSKLNLNPKQDSSFARGTITQAATSTISVGELAINGETDTLEAAGDSSFNGTLNVDTLRITQNQGLGAVTAENTANQIGTVTVSGSGNLGSVSVRDSNGGLNVNLNDSNSIGWFSFRTVGDLTLNAGSSINWMPNPAEVVFEASGGAFINQAGAGALNLDATNHQAARIYADDLTNTKPGGMSATPIYGETYATLPPTDTSLDNQINYFIYSTATAPVLRFTADNKSRLYGAANPALTYTTTGLVGGDAVSDVLIGGTPTLTCSATATSNVSTYPINNDGSGLTSPKYQLQFDNGALTVNQAPLSVTANNDSITYDATAYSGGNGVTYSGFVNGENSGVLGGTLSYSGSS